MSFRIRLAHLVLKDLNLRSMEYSPFLLKNDSEIQNLIIDKNWARFLTSLNLFSNSINFLRLLLFFFEKKNRSLLSFLAISLKKSPTRNVMQTL